MRVLRGLIAILLLVGLAAQFEGAHDHHCIVEQSACATCRVIVTPVVAPSASTVLLDLPITDPAIDHATVDEHRPNATLRDAFRLRAPPIA